MLRFHTQTAGSTLTADQFENNAIRVTLQALSAVLGGTQSLHTNARDEALALPSETVGAARAPDAAGDRRGVGRRERDRPARRRAVRRGAHGPGRGRGAAGSSREIDRLGGAAAAIEAGYYQREIHRSALKAQRDFESGRRVVVGVNKYRVEEKPPASVFRGPGRRRGARRPSRVKAVRARRNARAGRRGARPRSRARPRGAENLFPRVLALRRGGRHARRDLRDARASVREVPRSSGVLRNPRG